MLNGQNNVEEGLLKVERWKSEKVKRWLTPVKGEKVKGWKGEKMAFKGEKVKGWKGEKMAAPHRWTGRPNIAKSKNA